MKWSKTFCAATLVGLGLWALLPETASAQRRGGGGRGYSGPSWNNPGSSNYWGNYIPGNNNAYNNGYYNNGYNNGFYGNRNYGGYGNGYYRDGYYQNNRDAYYYDPGVTYQPAQPADNRPTSTIEVRVPDPNARVTIDGQPVTQSGIVRSFQTPPLEAGYRYNYTLRMESPSATAQQRTVSFRPGDRVVVDFTRPSNSNASPAPPATNPDPDPAP